MSGLDTAALGPGLTDSAFAAKIADFKKIFHIYNIDPEGDDPSSDKLSSTEVPKAMRAAGICLTEKLAKDIESDIDCDCDSMCDEALFLKLIQKHFAPPPNLKELMMAFSAINNGKTKMPTDELAHALTVLGPPKDRFSEEEVEQFKTVVDKKGTGTVNLKGFAKYMTTSIIPDTKISAT